MKAIPSVFDKVKCLIPMVHEGIIQLQLVNSNETNWNQERTHNFQAPIQESTLILRIRIR